MEKKIDGAPLWRVWGKARADVAGRQLKHINTLWVVVHERNISRGDREFIIHNHRTHDHARSQENNPVTGRRELSPFNACTSTSTGAHQVHSCGGGARHTQLVRQGRQTDKIYTGERERRKHKGQTSLQDCSKFPQLLLWAHFHQVSHVMCRVFWLGPKVAETEHGTKGAV